MGQDKECVGLPGTNDTLVSVRREASGVLKGVEDQEEKAGEEVREESEGSVGDTDVTHPVVDSAFASVGFGI